MDQACGPSRDSFSQNYASRAAAALETDGHSCKIKIEFSKASWISTREEYLHPNISYY